MEARFRDLLPAVDAEAAPNLGVSAPRHVAGVGRATSADLAVLAVRAAGGPVQRGCARAGRARKGGLAGGVELRLGEAAAHQTVGAGAVPASKLELGRLISESVSVQHAQQGGGLEGAATYVESK